MAGEVGSGLLSQRGGYGSCSKRLREQQLDYSRKRKTRKRKEDTHGSDAPGIFQHDSPGTGGSRAERDLTFRRVEQTSTAEEHGEEEGSEDEENDEGYGSEDTIEAEETGSEEDAEGSDDDDDVDLSEGCLDDFSEGSFSDGEQSGSDEHSRRTGASKGPSSRRVPNGAKVEGDFLFDKLEQNTGKHRRSKAAENPRTKGEIGDCRNSLLCTQMAWGDLPLSRPLLRVRPRGTAASPCRVPRTIC